MMQKQRLRLLALVMMVALLPCLPAGATDVSYTPDPSLWPKIDGSTATIPLTEAIVRYTTGCTMEQAVDVVKHNTTPTAYNRLIKGDVDLIFVTSPSSEELAQAKDAGIELVIIPVVKDALVFLNNIENPIEGLTQKQLRAIYQGETESWADVGGEKEPIMAFQRPVGSGSQTLFLQLLMGEQEPMEAPTEWIYGFMNSLVDAVVNYDNAKQSLGYSVYYYIHAMYGNERMRMLAVDGVAPTHDTIAAGEYPFTSYYYAVLRSDTPKDAPVYALVNWLLTEEGQRLTEAAGYVPMAPLAKDTAYHKITAQQAHTMMVEGQPYILLDVRTKAEFDTQHIDGALLIPDDEIVARAAESLPDKDALILIYCRSGRRSALAGKALADMGYTRVYDFGGIIDWPYETVGDAP